MSMKSDIIRQVRKTFDLAQDGNAPSQLSEKLFEYQEKSDPELFWQAFINHVQQSMIFYKTETAVERVMDFIATFSTYSTLKKNAEQKLLEEIEDEEEETMDDFLVRFMNFLLECHNARDKGVRYRCCQLINKLLNHLGDDDTIDEDISDAIYDCMMIRIKDKFPPIRIQAILALVRLQDPEDEECPVVDAFIHSLETDPNADVRKTIISTIALSRKTLPYLLERIKDVKDRNRKAAFLTLAEKVSIRALTIAQRISILTTGLNDRSQIVKQACMQLLRQWLKSYEHNVIKLLEALDTEGSPECSTILLESLFKDSSVEQLKLHVDSLRVLAQNDDGSSSTISHQLLTPENVFYWYMLCKHLKMLGDSGEVLLEKVLPELSKFCEYIQSYAEKYFIDSALLTAFEGKEEQTEFILQTLIKISGLLDLSDEVGRKNLQQLVHDLLVTETVPLSIVNELVTRFADVEKNEDKFVQALVETISEIKHPLVHVVTTAMKEAKRRLDLQVARVTMNLNECKEDLNAAIKGQDFQQAALLKDQIEELQNQKEALLVEMCKTEEQRFQRVEKDDPETMLRSMAVATSMLSKVNRKGLSSTLISLKEELIFEGVKNEDPFIRNEAVKCLGHLSLLHKDFACQHLVLFLQVAQVDQELLQITAVQVIFDLILMYGLEAFDVDINQTGTGEDRTLTSELIDDDPEIIAETPPGVVKRNAAESVLEILLMFLDSESADLRTTVAEGMAKLHFSGRIVSTKILTRLIILWYNPITEDDTKLRHCLGVFLPVFAFESRQNQSLIEECFFPVVKTLLNAPSSSPLNRVSVPNVINLLLQLTDIRNLAQMNNNKCKESHSSDFDVYVHDTIAVKLANEILSDPDDAVVKLFCKTLNQLHLSPRNTTAIADLIELIVKMLEVLKENKAAKKLVEKFQVTVQELFVRQGCAENCSVTAEAYQSKENLDPSENRETLDELVDDDDDDEETLHDNDNTNNTTVVRLEASVLQSQQNGGWSKSKKHKLSSSGEKTLPKRSRSSYCGSSFDFNVRHNSTKQETDESD